VKDSTRRKQLFGSEIIIGIEQASALSEARGVGTAATQKVRVDVTADALALG